mgnify:CR=1 FL=1
MVRFNLVEEFLEELEKDKEIVERKIVRITSLFTQTKDFPIKHLSVVASYKVAGELVRLKVFCGQIWESEHDKEVIDKARQIRNRIEKTCQEFTLEVRAGIYE